MDEADRILIQSLISIGLEISDINLSFEEFSPDILINATGICLEYIFECKNEQQSFPKSCPVNMASRYKVGQTLSEALKCLGYKDPIGYQAFLYPNIKDTRKIISFLIEAIPKETGTSVIEGLNETSNVKSIIQNTFSENSKSPWLPHYCQDGLFSLSYFSNKTLLIPFRSDWKQSVSNWFESFPNLDKQVDNIDELLVLALNYEMKNRICENIKEENIMKMIKEFNKNKKQEQSSLERLVQSSTMPKPRKRTKFINRNVEDQPDKEESNKEGNSEKDAEEAELEYENIVSGYEEAVINYKGLLGKIDKLNGKYDALITAEKELTAELDKEREKLDTREKTAKILSYGEEKSLEKLEAAIAKRRTQIGTIERQWQAHKCDLMERIETVRSKQIEKFGRTKQLEIQLDDVKEEMEALRKNFQEKDVEIKTLDEKVKQVIKNNSVKQNRNEFTKRILELTENKKKQKEEIKKILTVIFDLQKEINGLRGKLERSFIEARDCMLESSKRDEASRKMHAVLLGIHDNCASLVDVIEEKGRLIREIRDLETSIDNENKEDIEKNLEKITKDYNDAKQSCENLKKTLKDYKGQQQIVK